MRHLILMVLLLGLAVLLSCHKENPNEPPQENIHPQVDIPWPSLADSPWPMFHHDPQSTGRSQYIGPRKGKLKWTFKPNGAIYSAVVIGPDSVIYFPFSDGPEYLSGLYALYPNGILKWKLKIPLVSSTQPLIVADGTIFIVGGPSFDASVLNSLYAINPDGSIKNRFDLDFVPMTNLNIGIDGTLYLNSGTELYAVSQQGDIIWSFAVPNIFGVQSTVISPDGSTLYFYDYIFYHQISGIYALGTDGHLKWSFPVEGDQHAVDSPLVDSDGNIYFGTFGISDSCGLYALTPKGKQIWEYFSMVEAEPTVDNKGYIYCEIVSADAKLISLDYLGNLRWQKNIESNLAPFICDNEGVVFSCSYNGVSAFESDGKFLWQVPFDGKVTRVACPAIGYDGTLYIGTVSNPMQESKLYAIE